MHMLSQAALAALKSDQSMIRVTLEPLPELDKLQDIWIGLEERANCSFFLSWTWIGSWLPTISQHPELLVARVGTEVVGLGMVLTRMVMRHRVMPVWTLFLHQTGDPSEDIITIEYNDVLADRQIEQDVREACLRFLVQRQSVGRRRIGELVLGGLHEALSEDIKKLDRPCRELASIGSARVDLAALRRAGKAYQDSLRSSTARRLQRSISLYQARGNIELSSASSVEEALQFFDLAGSLHQERWIAKGHPGAFAYPFYIDFHRRLIRAAFPKGHVELLRVQVGGKPIGFLYNFLYRRKVYYYFSGFRFEDDNRLKPGLLCHRLCIEQHLSNGMDVYDFMGGEQRYKLELGQPGPRIIAMAVQRPNLLLAAERPIRRLKQAIKARQDA